MEERMLVKLSTTQKATLKLLMDENGWRSNVKLPGTRLPTLESLHKLGLINRRQGVRNTSWKINVHGAHWLEMDGFKL